MAIIKAPNGKKYDTVRRIFIDESVGSFSQRNTVPTRPISSYSSSYSRRPWYQRIDFVSRIGDWIDYNEEKIINASLVIAGIGLIIGIIVQWISSGFWSTLLTAVIVGAIIYYANFILFWLLILFIRLLRYIFYNIYTFLIFIAIATGICLYNYTDKPKIVENRPIATSVALQPNYYCSATTTLNVRNRPYANADQIGSLRRNEEVYVYSIDKNNFAKIDFKGSIAYASANYLKPKKTSTSTTTTSNTKQTNVNYSKITATINNIWTEHNVYQDGLKGMKIHVRFYTYNMRNIQGRCIAYFYYKNGNALKDNNNLYKTADGYVSIEQEFKPNYDNTTYEDFVLFIPYSELHLSSTGKTELKANLILWIYPPSEQPKQIARSDWTYFWYGKLD